MQLVSDAARAASRIILDGAVLARVQTIPGFDAYSRQAAGIWRAPVSHDAILASTLRDLGRFVSGVWSLHLNATPGGLTLTRLSDLLDQTGISSPGRARAMLVYLRFVGYIEPAPEAGDGRRRVFRPTGRMSAAFRARYRMEFEAAGPLDPDIAAALARIDEPTFFAALMAAMGELSLAGFQLADFQGASLNALSHHYAGMTVLAELLAIADQGESFPPVGPARFAVAGLAKACGISRSQVRRILRAGAGAGFFELTGEGQLILTPLLAEHVRMLIACGFLVYQWSCRRALTMNPADASPAAA